MWSADPRYQIPNRKFLTTKRLQEKPAEVKNNLI